MSSSPPPAAYRAARLLHQQSLTAQRPSSVLIGGTSRDAAVELGPVEFITTDSGLARGQRITARVLKSVLATPPAQKSLVYHDGVEFKVSEVGGRNANDVAWVIRGSRFID